MAIKKKTTLVIDHEAEEKAKQQAMERELAGEQPIKPAEIIKDNSVETNKTELKKIKSWSARSVMIVVVVCAVIGLIVWSVLKKSYDDKKSAEEAERKKAEAVAVEKANQAVAGELNKSDAERCQEAVDDYAQQICNAESRLKMIDEALSSEDSKKLPNDKRQELIQSKISNTLILEKGSSDMVAKLDKLSEELKKYNAGYIAYQTLAIEYVSFDRAKAIEAFKIAKQKHAEAIAADPTSDLDVYNFPTNEEELKIIYGE